MMPQIAKARQMLVEKVGVLRAEENAKPLSMAVFGQTGVGKSSLTNALWGTSLKTDAVRPCTMEPEPVVVPGRFGHSFEFWDLPGIGESDDADARYLSMYADVIRRVDLVLWAIHADTRSVSFDQAALRRLLDLFPAEESGEVLSRITFVVTKADLLAPPAWILSNEQDHAVFAPCPKTRALMQQKEAYFQDQFLRPYAGSLITKTYHDGKFDVVGPDLVVDSRTVTHRGVFDRSKRDELSSRFPNHADVFRRLCDNHRVICCSSLFRYNLTQLMLVAIGKVRSMGVGRLANFAKDRALSELNRVPLERAKQFGNIIAFDRASETCLYDLSQAPF